MININLTETQKLFLNGLPKGNGIYRRNVIDETLESLNLEWDDVKPMLENTGIVSKPKRGTYDLTKALASLTDAVKSVEATITNGLRVLSNTEVIVPMKESKYVAWGHFSIVKNIVASRQFYPVYITGPSGNGKTMMVKQACAAEGREYVRVQITPETDIDDLLGGFRLIDGETVFAEGPVITAMRRGAVLLIDEIDRATNKIMCLQGILEGDGVLIPKTGEVVYPAAGFTVLATANTRGRGSDDGRYIAASIIDDAFLERFIATLEQPFPEAATERKIVERHMEQYGFKDTESDIPVADVMVEWANRVRSSADEGEDLISTRRLCHIVQTLPIVGGDDQKAVELCIARFEPDTRETFLGFYNSIRPEMEKARAQRMKEAEAKERAKTRSSKAEDAAARVLNGLNP